MSIASKPMPLAEARQIADSLMNTLTRGCERIAPAGSIRREKPLVNDIEIVAIPSFATDMFGEPMSDGTALYLILSALCESGSLNRVKGGDKYRQYIVTRHGCKLDLFLASAETWASVFTIRTGSAEFSHRLVTPRKHGGLCPSNMQFRGGRLYRDGEIVPTPEEIDLFRELGVDWVDPKDRA